MGTSSTLAARDSAHSPRYFQPGTALHRVLMAAPYLTRCSDDKTARLTRPREYAIAHPYMQVNRRDLVSWLIFDLDHPNSYIWQDAGLPAPNLIVRNPASGSSHLFYAITPVCTSDRGRSRPIAYMRAVRDAMALELRADLDYASGPVAKTPGHPAWWTTELHSQVYELGKLADYVDLATPARGPKRQASNHEPASRHCQLFHLVRPHAYRTVNAARSAPGGYERFVREIEAYAHSAIPAAVLASGSAQGALPASSVHATARSIARWTWDRYRGKGGVARGVMALDAELLLRERQGQAAMRTHEVRRRATTERIRAAAAQLNAMGHEISDSAIARAAHLARQTVAAYRVLVDELRVAARPPASLAQAVAEPFQRIKQGVKDAVHQVAAEPKASLSVVAAASAGKAQPTSRQPRTIADTVLQGQPIGKLPACPLSAAQESDACITSSGKDLVGNSEGVVHQVRAGRRRRPEYGAESGNRWTREQLDPLRSTSLIVALKRLGIHAKLDPDFRPMIDVTTERWHISAGAAVHEVLIKGSKWFDVRRQKGGGGSIDLLMHLEDLSFAQAVRRLQMAF